MSLSDISDLTDISSGEDDVPLAKRATKAKKAPKEYKIGHVLRAPRTAQYTAKSLYDQIIDNAIDLDPEYQREIVWQEEKQSGLIDSILRNYYIPPIIFAVTIQDDGSELRTCIDGKQRLTSIQRFFDGQIPHKDSFTNEKLWFKTSATNTKRKLLPQYLRTQFANKQIVCVEYTGLDNDQEREIFQRVQLGVALTPAERLQALAGPWSTTIREIQNHVLGEEGFEGYLDWGHARGRDFQCLATIGHLIENHPKISIPGTKTLEKWLQKNQPVSAQLRADLHETFRIFVTLARDKKYSGSLNRPTRVSPIEFVMIGVLIYLKRQTLSLTQISSAIEKMRKDVRASHKDIRSNTRVTKHLVEFMAKKIKVSELKSDGDGDKPAILVVAKPAKPAKRKRPVYSDDSDSDHEERISKVNPSNHPTSSTPIEVVKSSKSDQKPTGTKKTGAAAIPQVSVMAKPSQPAVSSRKTNNSMSGLLPIPSEKSPLLTPTVKTTTHRAPSPPPPPHPSNGRNTHLHTTSTESGPSRIPLTVQTGPIKVESPRIGSLNSPAPLSVLDRLAPIRAAKASLTSSIDVRSPSVGEMRSLVAQTTTGLSQNYTASQPARYQSAVLSQPQPSPQPSSVQSLSQHFPGQVEEVLQALRSQLPQLDPSAQTMGSNPINMPTGGQNSHFNGIAGRPGISINANNPGEVPQGYEGAATPHGTSSRKTRFAQPLVNPNQASAPNNRPPSSLGISGDMTYYQQHSMSSSTPTSTGMHTLPQKPPIVPGAPRSSTRAEPLGPSRSMSSESSSRRGSYSRDRHRPPDDRRSSRYDREHDDDYDRRNRYHRRS